MPVDHCIKCGRQIADGELFCVACGLNPGASVLDETQLQSRRPEPVGRMQTPQIPTARQASHETAHRAAKKTVGAKPKPRPNKGWKIALAISVCVSLLLAGVLITEYSSLKVERTRLETKEADMLLREQEKTEMQQTIAEINAEMEDLKGKIRTREDEIHQLKLQLSGSQSSQSQSEYDLSAALLEMERLQKDNAQLLEREEELEHAVQELTNALEAARSLEEKAAFMDSYVVFAPNDGTRLYHTYDCSAFAKSNFWAYSRKLAESNGFAPCPVCGGRP